MYADHLEEGVRVALDLGFADAVDFEHRLPRCGLEADEFRFEPAPGAEWRSAETGAVYETEWRVSVPGEGIEVALRPLVEGAEFRSRALGVIYWEAGVDAVAPDGRTVGRGFVELTGRVGLSAAPG